MNYKASVYWKYCSSVGCTGNRLATFSSTHSIIYSMHVHVSLTIIPMYL